MTCNCAPSSEQATVVATRSGRTLAAQLVVWMVVQMKPQIFGLMVAVGIIHAEWDALTVRDHARVRAEAGELALQCPADLDTDALGTFTGEVERTGTPLETAIAKARLGMAASGTALGLANEGSFGAHPANPFIPGNQELLVLVDEERGMVVQESLLSHRTCHSQTRALDIDALQPYLQRIGFPRQGVIVRPAVAPAGVHLYKGLTDWTTVANALGMCAHASEDGHALVQPDLRAHLSPLRMRVIRRLGWRMAERLARLCPSCASPGFGRLESRSGLPCAWCAEPTRLPLAEIQGCSACSHRETRPPAHGLREADAGYCDRCNP